MNKASGCPAAFLFRSLWGCRRAGRASPGSAPLSRAPPDRRCCLPDWPRSSLPSARRRRWPRPCSSRASSASAARHSPLGRGCESGGVCSLSLDWLFPAVRLARVYPILHVRHEFPVRAAYSRRVLRHVTGFPRLRLLCPIRHLEGMRPLPACPVAPCSITPPERTPCRGSSPVRVPAQPVLSSHFIQEPSGLPEFSDVSLPACHGLRTPTDLHAQAIPGASCCLPAR